VRVLVCGAQVPFTRGGAELHMENLLTALRGAGHEAELVRLPVAWDAERVLESALAWRSVPLDGDVVVTTNFPSYFARHPRKVVWLFHQHRAAYDAADAPWSGMGDDDASLELQRLLADWDTRVLEEATALFTTSATVADRLVRYNGLEATPLAHPPPLADRLVGGTSGDYVFCPTRLAANKRPELLAGAMAHCGTGVRAVIAGTGPLRPDLERLAREAGLGGRLELAGFVGDDELVALYAGSLAVVYAPFDEDYGYVTLQAFLASKPVVTCTDSGGVLEWVRHGENGLVVEPTAEAVGAAVERLAADPGLARRLGSAGRRSVEDLRWEPVVQRLLGPAS